MIESVKNVMSAPSGSMEVTFDGLLSIGEKTTPISNEVYNSSEPMVTRQDSIGEPIILEHERVLSSLLSEVKPIDFHSRAGLGNLEKIEKKHQLIIATEEIIKLAHSNSWSLCMSDGFLYVFNGAFWKQISAPELETFLGNASEAMGVGKFNARYYCFRADLSKQFLSAGYLPKPKRTSNEVEINLRNGTFVITPKEQYLKKFDREDFIKYQLQFEFDEQAQAPMFQKYLDEVLPDGDQQKVLAEYVGYVFVKQKVLKLEKALVLYGDGANGKSVFFDIINALLGRENICNYTLESLTNIGSYQRANLSDKLLNYASEISPKMDVTIFKQLVSGEPVEARLPYKDPFMLYDYAKFIFNTNSLPRDVEQNEAFFRRFILIHFNVTIPENERDVQLASKIIETELTGVFNWVLGGLRRLLLNRNFTNSTKINAALKEYRLQSDSVSLFLDDENYISSNKDELPLKSLHFSYKNYCEESGYKPCALKTFAERIRFQGIEVTRKSAGNVVGMIKRVL